jgi:hypothetical protein
VDYDALVHEQQQKLVSGEARLEVVQKECFEKVDSATELAEKQNALTMTLEAKVMVGMACVDLAMCLTCVSAMHLFGIQIEKLQRDKQLRTAQLTAMQQREESFRARLQASLHDYCTRLRVAAPPDGCKLVDLLHYSAEILRSRTGSVLDADLRFGPSAAPERRANSPGQRKSTSLSHSGSDSAGKTRAGKKGSSGGKRSQSTSPEEDKSVTRNEVVRRLSPAAQRFVAESAEFSSSAAAARRLPSPMVGRVRYDSSFNTVRSPSVDTTMHRSFGVTSIDDLATSRLSTRSLPAPALAPGVSRAGRTSSPWLTVRRQNSSAQPLSSSSVALQERLREAQKAFAAMRESHNY